MDTDREFKQLDDSEKEKLRKKAKGRPEWAGPPDGAPGQLSETTDNSGKSRARKRPTGRERYTPDADGRGAAAGNMPGNDAGDEGQPDQGNQNGGNSP